MRGSQPVDPSANSLDFERMGNATQDAGEPLAIRPGGAKSGESKRSSDQNPSDEPATTSDPSLRHQ